MDGIVLIDKASDWTSFDAVAKLRGAIRAQSDRKKPKVGHTGTLDPLATGLLILVVGSYCKQANRFSGLDKTYEAELRLGMESTTGDDEGTKTFVSDQVPDIEQIQTVLKGFLGAYSHVPPAHSAKKIGGVRSYKLARAGSAQALDPVTVTILANDMLGYEYPYLRIKTTVSSGTYIRTLAQDIGKKLGTGAYLTSLRRTAVGQFSIKDAVDIHTACNDVSKHLQTTDIDKLD